MLLSRKIKIKHPQRNIVVLFIDYSSFSRLKVEQELSRKNFDYDRGISRSYVSNEGKIYLEFYFGGAIEVTSIEDIKLLQRVKFEDLIWHWFGEKISYSIKLTKDEFQLFSNEMKPYQIVSVELQEFIKQAFANSDGIVLVEAFGGYNSENDYIILGSREMFYTYFSLCITNVDQMVDVEIKNTVKQDFLGERLVNFYPEILDGMQINRDEGKKCLARLLNLDEEIFDYSENSLRRIENSLFENSKRLGEDELYHPFLSYIGEVFGKKHPFLWQHQPSQRVGDPPRIFIKMSSDGQEIDIEEILHLSVFRSDIGMGVPLDALHELYGKVKKN